MLAWKGEWAAGLVLLLGTYCGCHSQRAGSGGATSSASLTVGDAAGGAQCPVRARLCPDQAFDTLSCAPCLMAGCCAELMAANGDAESAAVIACGEMACVSQCYPRPFPSPICSVPATAPSNGACAQIGGSMQCNPVTNEGCQPGSACGESPTGFLCYPNGNTQALCEPCGQSNMYCQGGLACAADHCARYCCSDADCGMPGACQKGVFIDDLALGVCGNVYTNTTVTGSSATTGGCSGVSTSATDASSASSTASTSAASTTAGASTSSDSSASSSASSASTGG